MTRQSRTISFLVSCVAGAPAYLASMRRVCSLIHSVLLRMRWIVTGAWPRVTQWVSARRCVYMGEASTGRGVINSRRQWGGCRASASAHSLWVGLIRTLIDPLSAMAPATRRESAGGTERDGLADAAMSFSPLPQCPLLRLCSYQARPAMNSHISVARMLPVECEGSISGANSTMSKHDAPAIARRRTAFIASKA